jgi:glycosyltransferase involved in cell wall biosynthesis
MLEAMACGVPVVTASARSPDSLRIVRDGEGGRVVPADYPDALVRIMVELCDDADQRRRLGVNGRQRAEALFGCDRLVDETVRLYDALLALTPRGTEV